MYLLHACCSHIRSSAEMPADGGAAAQVLGLLHCSAKYVRQVQPRAGCDRCSGSAFADAGETKPRRKLQQHVLE